MLRSKNGDSNSYNSGDEVNNIRWDDLVPGSDVMNMRNWYRGLIALRKASPFITRGEVSCEVVRENAIEVIYTMDGETVAYALINPSQATLAWPLPEGEWGVLMYNETIDPEASETISGTAMVEGRTVLLVKAK